MKVVLLGTGGPMGCYGPDVPPWKVRCGASQVVVVGDRGIMIDCGMAATAQLCRAGIGPWQVSHLLFTHVFHYDHMCDYSCFVFTRWLLGHRNGVTEPLRVVGPRGAAAFNRNLFEVYQDEIAERASRRPWAAPVVEESEGGLIVGERDWRALCAPVNHGPWPTALAYRVEAEGKAVVFSGDVNRWPREHLGETWPCPTLVDLARDADLLVMDAGHNRAADVGRAAQDAGVRKLVLSHLEGPPVFGHGEADTPEYLEAVRQEFKGPVVVGEDLMSLLV